MREATSVLEKGMELKNIGHARNLSSCRILSCISNILGKCFSLIIDFLLLGARLLIELRLILLLLDVARRFGKTEND